MLNTNYWSVWYHSQVGEPGASRYNGRILPLAVSVSAHEGSRVVPREFLSLVSELRRDLFYRTATSIYLYLISFFGTSR